MKLSTRMTYIDQREAEKATLIVVFRRPRLLSLQKHDCEVFCGCRLCRCDLAFMSVAGCFNAYFDFLLNWRRNYLIDKSSVPGNNESWLNKVQMKGLC